MGNGVTSRSHIFDKRKGINASAEFKTVLIYINLNGY